MCVDVCAWLGVKLLGLGADGCGTFQIFFIAIAGLSTKVYMAGGGVGGASTEHKASCMQFLHSQTVHTCWPFRHSRTGVQKRHSLKSLKIPSDLMKQPKSRKNTGTSDFNCYAVYNIPASLQAPIGLTMYWKHKPLPYLQTLIS